MQRRRHVCVVVSAASMMIGAAAADGAALRVCADPNNLPFSDQAGQGFENKIVALIASDLGSTVDYTWWAQRRGYVRHTLKADTCDIWPGIASGAEMMTSTRPYYRSSYVFVTRADRRLHIASFDDPQLRKLVIGVQMVGEDAMNTPPAHALASRGIVQNVRGYMLYGDYRQPHPPSTIIDAVEDGDLDVAVVWGPMAGYFAALSSKPLTIEPVQPLSDGTELPMVFYVSMGVRRGDNALQRIDDSLRETTPNLTRASPLNLCSTRTACWRRRPDCPQSGVRPSLITVKKAPGEIEVVSERRNHCTKRAGIAALLLAGSATAALAADAAAGQQIFKAQCGICHSVAAGVNASPDIVRRGWPFGGRRSWLPVHRRPQEARRHMGRRQSR